MTTVTLAAPPTSTRTATLTPSVSSSNSISTLTGIEVPELEEGPLKKQSGQNAGGCQFGIRRLTNKLWVDPVHSAKTEPEAGHLKRRGPRMAIKVARLLMARRKLAAIIREETPTTVSHPLRNDLALNPPRYLHLLRLHPSLARDRFRRRVGMWGDEFSIYPLVFCIEIGASLDIIQEVFDMFPEALSQPVSPLEGDYPLHLACSQLHKAPVSVILFLAQAYADAVKMEDLDGFLPLHRLLYKPQRAATLHEVHTLLDIYPQSQAFDCVFGSPLLLAMDAGGTKRDVLTCLIKRFPKDITELHLGERVPHSGRKPAPGSRKNYSVMSLDHARLVTPILSQIHTLTLTPQQWSPRAFLQVMMELYRQPQLVELDLHLPPNLLQRDDFCCSMIQQLLQQNRGLRHLAIDFGHGAGDVSYSPNPDLSGTETCLHYLGAGLCQNHTLQTVHVAKNNILTHLQANLFRRAIWIPLAKVLQLTNATLQVVSIPHVDREENLPKDGQVVQYYARLNQFGRKQARDPRITTLQFVRLLQVVNGHHSRGQSQNSNSNNCIVPSAPSDPQQQQQQPVLAVAVPDHPLQLQLHNVLFGLLQECPSRWAS